jgi:hypothetical protein
MVCFSYQLSNSTAKCWKQLANAGPKRKSSLAKLHPTVSQVQAAKDFGIE